MGFGTYEVSVWFGLQHRHQARRDSFDGVIFLVAFYKHKLMNCELFFFFPLFSVYPSFRHQ